MILLPLSRKVISQEGGFKIGGGGDVYVSDFVALLPIAERLLQALPHWQILSEPFREENAGSTSIDNHAAIPAVVATMRSLFMLKVREYFIRYLNITF